MKKFATLLTALFAVYGLMAQSSQGFWKEISTNVAFSNSATKAYLPVAQGRTFSLDFASMQNYLGNAPKENSEAAMNNPLLVDIPMPDGEMITFGIYEISIMAPELAAEHPEIKTYAGQSKKDPEVSVRITTGPLGFHSTVFRRGTADVVESVAVGNTEHYLSFNVDDAIDAGPVVCGNHDITEPEEIIPISTDAEVDVAVAAKAMVPVELRTYRAAVATTAEYSSLNGGTTSSVLNAVTSVMNQVNAIFEKDHAVRLELIANTSDVFFFPPAIDDPYENGDLPSMLQVNPIVLNNAFGVDAYDVGHVFGRALGAGTVGLASLASTCNDEFKGRGGSNVLGPNFYQTVAHEYGHQFNATHTFNLCDNENENPGTGYEPGGGSTIMAYAGACGSNSVQQDPDDYFHINSMERIKSFLMSSLSGGSCGTAITTGNNTPEVDIPIDGGFAIPVSTPFELTGVATDTEGDDMVYNWEQYDLGPASPLGSPSPTGTPPLFRSVPPTDDPTRVFPRIQSIVNNTSQITEVLPTTTRDLTFRFIARDCNSEAGGYAYQEIAFTSNANAGPFLVTSPNAGTESWVVGEYLEVTWDVANTDGPQVDCQFVDIYLSRDGGLTYPITLLANTKNDGSAFVVVPDEVTNLARVKVKGRDNIFFDISNENFSIEEATAPDFTVSSYTPECGEVCVPSTFEVTLETAAILGFSEMITFSATNLPAGATVSFSANPVAPGTSTVATFDFSDAALDDEVEVTIVAEAMGVDNEERIVQLNVVSSDFSALVLNEPAGSAISTLPDYDWNDLPNGLSYNIEVSTDPGFNTIIDSATGLTETTYQSSITLEEGTVYYWRVAVGNECGTGDFSDINAFKTVAQSCETYTSSGSIDIPTNSGFADSEINVPVGGEISDVNVRNVTGVYAAFGNLTFDLFNPAGTSIALMVQQPCNSEDAFNVGFDDQSPNPPNDIACPPVGGVTYQSSSASLSTFNLGDALGTWRLRANVVGSFAAGGQLDEWSLEICGASTPLDPYIITNESVCARPGMTTVVPSEYLEVGDDDNVPAEIKLTISSNTQHGYLSLGGIQLGTGDSFTMQDIYTSQVTYTNTDDTQTEDQFSFIAEDNTGGFYGLPTVDIEINGDCIVDTKESLIDGSRVAVYPNPATDVLNVELLDENLTMEQVAVYNAQGQLVLDRSVEDLQDRTQFQIGHLPSGVYLVQVRTEEGIGTKRVIID